MVRSFGVAILSGVVVATVYAGPVAAKPKPTVVVRPSSGLVDGQKVHVVARHEPVGLRMVAAECTAAFPEHGAGDCLMISVKNGNDKGAYKFRGRVYTGTIGQGTCGTSSADNNCVVAVMQYNGGSHVWDTAHATTTPISFALPS